ncbi:SDR family oxidoreductase [Nonomuraea angiospora]|uniref:SDR family oxidoreductase n=1 Tax=Nonomuraea angiospora TaxID=46172 RepID=UPI00341C241B
MPSSPAQVAGSAGFTPVLAVEGAEHGIRVNALAPIAATRMLLPHLGENTQLSPEAMAMMNAVVSELDPALVAPVAAFLAHEDCPITGEIYTAGGGVHFNGTHSADIDGRLAQLGTDGYGRRAPRPPARSADRRNPASSGG